VPQPGGTGQGVVVAVWVAHTCPAGQVGVAVAPLGCTCTHWENSEVLPTASVAVAVRKEPDGAAVGSV
jgi:hypothetical protein